MNMREGEKGRREGRGREREIVIIVKHISRNEK